MLPIWANFNSPMLDRHWSDHILLWQRAKGILPWYTAVFTYRISRSAASPDAVPRTHPRHVFTTAEAARPGHCGRVPFPKEKTSHSDYSKAFTSRTVNFCRRLDAHLLQFYQPRGGSYSVSPRGHEVFPEGCLGRCYSMAHEVWPRFATVRSFRSRLDKKM